MRIKLMFIMVFCVMCVMSCGTVGIKVRPSLNIKDGITSILYIDTSKDERLKEAVKQVQRDIFYSDMKIYTEEDNLREKTYELFKKIFKREPVSDKEVFDYFDERLVYVDIRTSMNSRVTIVSLSGSEAIYTVTMDITFFKIKNFEPIRRGDMIDQEKALDEVTVSYTWRDMFYPEETRDREERYIILVHADALRKNLKNYKKSRFGAWY